MKNPFLIIAVLFLAVYLLVGHFNRLELSDEPIQLSQAEPPEIVMFGTESCRYCTLARAFFKKHNIAYTEHDIEKSDKHLQLFYLMGGKGTPLIIVNETVIHGFEEDRIRAAL